MNVPDLQRTLTTGQVGDYCRVNYRTVIRWIKAGRLEAHQLPGRGDHRVEVRDFLSFLHDNNLPIPFEFVNHSRRILIVDDDPSMAASIRRALRREGYETQIAETGFRAGAMLASFRPQLVTLDLRMPGVGGLDVLKFIRASEDYRDVKVLVVSGESRDAIDGAVAAGADAGLQKPFQNPVLLAEIKSLLDANTPA